jgi:hypothetical protein
MEVLRGPGVPCAGVAVGDMSYSEIRSSTRSTEKVCNELVPDPLMDVASPTGRTFALASTSQ